jgi:hypothetical protein
MLTCGEREAMNRQNDSATVKQNSKATEQHRDAQADGSVKPM